MPGGNETERNNIPVINLPSLTGGFGTDPNSIYAVNNGGVSPFGSAFSSNGAMRRMDELPPRMPTASNPFAGMQNPRATGTPSAGQVIRPFAMMQNPFNQVQQWQGNAMNAIKPFARNVPTGRGGMPNGMGADEKKWADMAARLGLDWNTTKNVYMRSPRNPNFSESVALALHADDDAWGRAARQAGVLTGNPDWDANVWRDHYEANGNMDYDPLRGHNYAIMQYEANQKAMEQQANGTPQPPAWLK